MEDVYRVNSIEPSFMISKLLPLIIENVDEILNVASIMGTLFDIEKDSLTYNASKWTFRGASFNLENKLKNTPCRVITFNPGEMNTELYKRYNENLDFAKDWMNPNDIANIIIYILNLSKQVEVPK